MRRFAPENLRRVLASNVRASASMMLGTVHVPDVATLTGWHPSRLHDVLSERFSLCSDQLDRLATGLRTTPAAVAVGQVAGGEMQ